MTISTLAEQLGYSQASSFIRNFKREEGMTPGDYHAVSRKEIERSVSMAEQPPLA